MKLLSFDSSAVTASAALTDDGNVVRSEFVNAGLTHSETLLPMIERVMCNVDYSELDGIALTAGPGSFTGVRIGVATAKGLAFKHNTPCYSISTLEAIAYNFVQKDCIVCAVMDARRMQFYNALFSIKDGIVSRLTPDRAIVLDDLKKEIVQYDEVIIAGDGARLCYDNANLDNCSLADENNVYQNAVSVSLAAKNKKPLSPDELMPVYLRLSQAERELKLKLKK